MTKAKGRAASIDRKFPVEVATWIATNPDLIDTLLCLRELGDDKALPPTLPPSSEQFFSSRL